jgi:hypothetical protein
VLLAAWLLWFAASPVEPASKTIEWRAPSECPSAAEFAARVDELRGDAVVEPGFEFVVTRARGRLELQIAEHDARYTARRCEALVDTALLLVSLALIPAAQDPATVPSTIANSDLSARRPTQADLRIEAADVAPFLRPDVRSDLVAESWEPGPARLLAEVGLAGFLTPQPAAELFVGAGPRGRVWAVDLGLLARPRFAGVSPAPGVGVRLSTWGGLVRTCVGGRGRRVAVAGCGGLELALISARADGEVSQARVGRRPWMSVELGPELGVRVADRITLVARISATWLAVRPNFEVVGAGAVCCARDLGISGRVGVDFGLGK